MMMRHSLIARTALAGFCVLLATPALADTKNGFYAGLVGGYSNTDLDLEAGPVGSPDPTIFDQASLHAADFGIVGGYHHNLPRNFFIEAEAEALVSGGRETGLFASDVKVEKDGSFGIYLKPGYQINEKWGTFLTLGAQWIEYTVTNAPADFKDSDSSAGFLHGIGVNYALDEDVTLTAEYNRVQPLDVKYEYVPGATWSRFDPELDIVKLALKYNF